MKVRIRKGSVEYGKAPKTEIAGIGSEIDLQDTDARRLTERGVVEQVAGKASRSKPSDGQESADQ